MTIFSAAPDPAPSPHKQTKPTAPRSRFLRWHQSDVARLLVLNVFLFLGMSIAMPHLFLSGTNIASMTAQFPGYGLLALAMAVPMMTGGIDLSIISLSNLTSILAALALHKVLGAMPTISLYSVSTVSAVCFGAVLLGAVGGLLNGFIIGRMNVTPILATLGSSLIFLGAALVITDGTAVFGLPAAFGWIGSGKIFNIPASAWLFFIVAACLSIVLTKTAFGSKVYLLGTNARASRYAGLGNRQILYKTYVTSAVCAVMAGIVITASANSAKADYGGAYLLQSILICVLGGVSPFGGRGRIAGVVLAVFALQFLSTGFNLFGANNFLAEAIWGLVLLATMTLSRILNTPNN
jgi:simple sugar transport system permease protein